MCLSNPILWYLSLHSLLVVIFFSYQILTHLWYGKLTVECYLYFLLPPYVLWQDARKTWNLKQLVTHLQARVSIFDLTTYTETFYWLRNAPTLQTRRPKKKKGSTFIQIKTAHLSHKRNEVLIHATTAK